MIRIKDFASKATLKAAALVSVLLLFAAVTGFGQQTINLTAAPTTATMPDGTVVPMWGYFCGTAVSGSTASCAAANPNSVQAPTLAWAANTPYLLGAVILDSNGNVQKVTTAGTSGSSAPTWSTTTGGTTTDPATGSTTPVVWTFQGSLASYLATTATWSPVVITVPTGQGLTINLTNDLSFTTTGTANTVPTSIVILGQVGGGLGNSPTSTPSPTHTNAQGCGTWFIASGATPPGTPCTAQQSGASGTPPVQAPRVQSMATEVTTGTTSSLTWAALKPGTFLLESGTHPSIQVPMGLIGTLVVTTAPSGTTAGTAYPGVAATTTTAAVPAVPYNAEVPVEFSEIDPVQNKEVDQAVRTAGFSETSVWTRMNTGSITALTLTSPGSGYTTAPAVSLSGGCTPPATCGGATASATIGYGLASVTVTNGGSGYTTAPSVSFGGNGDATATATLAYGTVGGVSISSGGSGYAVGNALTFTGGGTPTTVAAGTVSSIAAGVSAVTVTTGGSGYTTATVAFSGGGGTGATATATITGGSITAITVTNPGSGYTSAPTVTITGTNTTPATAAASLSSTGAIAGVTLSTGGAGYTSSPTIGVAIGSATVVGTGAVLLPTFAVGTVTVSNAGAYTSAPTVQFAGGGGTGAAATATLSTTSSLILTLTNGGGGYTTAPTVTIAPPGGTGTTATATATVGTGGCGVAHTCYPPAVNYTPFYYLINGAAFNKTAATVSVFPATAGTATNTTTGVTSPVLQGITGTVLVRIVNAGLRLHVPSIVGSLTQGFNGAGTAATVGGFTLIAEDGNPLPEVQVAGVTTVPAAPRVQTDVLMVPSKVYDALINAPQPVNGAVVPALPIYDRQLSLSGNSSVRDAGMLAYISVNNPSTSFMSSLPAMGAGALFAAALANPDTYNGLVAGQPFTVSDPAKGVIANDINVYGVTLLVGGTYGPTSGTITCGVMSSVLSETVGGMCANGTFTYTPNTGSTATSDSFTYCANNGINTTTTPPTCPTALTAKVTLGPSTVCNGVTNCSPVANNITYTARMSNFLKIPSAGVLEVDSDPNNLPLQVVVSSVATTTTGLTVNMDPNGGFTATLSPAPTTATVATFTYVAQNSQGRQSGTATVTIDFPAPSNLVVKVIDAQAYNTCQGASTCIAGLTPMSDYRWIIEEDRTFWVDPNCTVNNSGASGSTGTYTPPPGCPGVVPGPPGQTTVPTFGVNFHASTMPFIAQGCTGPLSCEGGQTMLDTRPACTSAGVPAGCSATAGQHIPAVCDLGNGACRPDPNCTALPCLTSGGTTQVLPGAVHLDPAKRYYISVLPGDAGNPFPSNSNPPTTAACAAGGVITVGGVAQLNTGCGHTMSGAPVPAACNLNAGATNPCTTSSAFAPVTVLVLPTPLPTGKLSVMVFEDDFPLNGEQDGGGGIDTISPNEPGLDEFNIVLWDTYGGLGDVTGQNTYDMFNQPLSNSLSGTIDPATGFDACPVSATPLLGSPGSGTAPNSPQATGMTGMIVTCPKYESDGQTLSPLAGQAVVANLMPEKFSVQAYPGASRIARGEQWLQTNTLDGQHPHDSFIRIGEPSYFQEYGPAGFHVAIGFANPAIINARHDGVCSGTYGSVGPCTNTIDGQVDVQRQSRTPDQRLYPSGSRDAFAWTQCWVSLGDPDAEDFMFTFCDAKGNFSFSNVPGGNWRLTIGDQWNDQIIDGLSTPANVGCIPTGTATTCTPGPGTITALHLGNIGVQQWQANLYTTTYIDDNHNGIKDPGEIGIPFLYNMIQYRDGHNSNALVTDFNGVANFNETFPLFNWYVVSALNSSTATRYKLTGTHTVYDAGGPADGSTLCGTSNGARPCGTATAYSFLANTNEQVPLPGDLSVPGAVYCASADCKAEATTFQAGTAKPSTGLAGLSTGRIDPPWVMSEGWSGETSQGNWIEFGMAPYAPCPPACVVTGTTTTTWGENGGIHGIVDYAATRPFDTADQMIQQPWEPYVPNVTLNLYQEGFASDGVTPTLTLVDTTQTSSWDDWAQGFYPGSAAGSGTGAGQKPYMSCPGQGTATGTNADLFYFTLFDQPNFLDSYNSIHNGGTLHTLPYNAQYKCYDAMHIWNQIQPAPIDGRYSFPSSLGINPTTGKPINTQITAATSPIGKLASMPGTYCTVCVPNPTTAILPSGTDLSTYDPYRSGNPMLPPGKYVVEVVMPPGYEVYKEEDKNLLIGDNFIAPVTQQFGGLGGFIFIIPDQASVASLYDQTGAGYNPNNFQDQTTSVGLANELSGVPGFPGFQDPNWPCAGEQRVVPDYLSLFPQAKEVAPFAGATRPLCDRKEVTLVNQMSVHTNFFIYTSTHIASKFTGVITDDFTSEFDPFAPQFGEKFAPPNLPISTKDYLGNEISRVYSDNFGLYDGLTFSSWEVNPPNITGYSPTIMVQCMNDPGPIPNGTVGLMNDKLYNPSYSNFCYEEPYMPGLTTYLDTPVVPTQAFVGAAYNNADCAYPDATPAIAEVDGDGVGPWVSATGHTLTITALGDQQVGNSAYSGPSASVAPFNQTTIKRHYGFGTSPSVTIGGVPQTCSGGDLSLTCTVSVSGTVNGQSVSVPNCTIQQQAQYGGSAAQCGQLLITNTTTGKQSIDTVTVTIGGKQPDHVPASDTIQSHIDKAAPGDLIIVDPTCSTTAGPVACPTTTTTGVTKSAAAHTELLLMWKPVRLQGVGAATTIINANTHPAGKLLDPWRRHINCLFGLTLQGVPYGNTTPYDSPTDTANNGQPYACPETGWQHFSATGQTVSTGLLINLTSGGSGYTTAPGVNIPAPDQPGGTQAVATTVIDTNTGSPTFGQVTAITVTTPGSGYTVAPTVTIAAPGGTGTTATALATLPVAGGTVVAGKGSSPQVDRLPLEATIGWDATLNGNLAEQLQEPTLMGAYEGAGITVLAKGVDFHGVSPWNDGTENGAFPTGTTLLSGTVSNPGAAPSNTAPSTNGGLLVGDANPFCAAGGTNPFPSNFICNPSSIDGLSVTNSSQGGGGIFVHGWAHFIQIANNRVYNNAGTLSGGISIGQGEFAGPYSVGGTNAPPGTCSDGTGFVTNEHEPDCFQLQPNVHNNMISQNSSLGDELFSATLSGGGGVSFCTGNDYYKFNFNWVCGNLSAGEGGGLVHLGEIFNGDIEHNTIVLNQSSNPTIPTNGGGIEVMGTPDTDPTCPGVPDADCPPGLSDGTGPGLVINANLIQANSADSGSGGGIRLQNVNGTEVGTFASQPQYWHDVTITNNIIVNNMAGWDGAGISLQDALNVNIVNNTIAHNDTLASSGVLTTSIGAPMASAPSGNCTQPGPTGPDTASCPQSAGVTSTPNSSLLSTSLGSLNVICPPGHASCKAYSNPLLFGDLIFQNRSFYVGITGPGTLGQNQQNLVGLFDAFTNAAVPTQASTGACSSALVSYWDLGVRGDKVVGGAPNHASGLTLTPVYSFLSNTTGYNSTNSQAPAGVIAQYCNGSRVPPECTASDGCGGPHGFGTPPGIADALTPNPQFSLVPSATVDEGNNWINVSWGPLALSNPAVRGTDGNYAGGPALGNYALASGSAAVDFIPCSNPGASQCTTVNLAPIYGLPTPFQLTLPATDFFGNQRPDAVGAPSDSNRPCTPNPGPGHPCVDVGAVETGQNGGPPALNLPAINAIVPASTTHPLTGSKTVPVTITGTHLTGAETVNITGFGVTAGTPTVNAAGTLLTVTFTVQSTATLGSDQVTVTTSVGTSNARPFTVN